MHPVRNETNSGKKRDLSRSHTSAHEALPAELERIFDAPFTFAACAYYLVKMAS